MALVDLLSTLARTSDRAAREDAAAGLYETLRGWAPGVIRRRYPNVPDDVIDEAIQKVVLKASLGRSRFRGDSDPAARAWCTRILQRYALDWLRRNRRHLDLDDAPQTPAPAEADALLGRDIVHLLERLDTVLAELHRPRDLDTVRDHLRCHLELRLGGAGLDEQMARWAPTSAAEGTADWRRARDRVYQYRRRGKVAGCRGVETLLEAEEITAVEADLLVRLLGCQEAG